MKISELVTLDEEQLDELMFDIELDTPVLSLPKKLKRLFCRAQISKDNPSDLDRRFLGLLSSLILARRVEIVVEIPHENELDIIKLCQISNTMGFNLSFLHDKKGSHEQYISSICTATKYALTTRTFTRVYYPISSYLTYKASMALEIKTDGVPNDDYLNVAFFKNMPQSLVDGFKLGIDQVILDVYGDVEAFNTEIYTCALATSRLIKGELEDIQEEIRIFRKLRRKPHRSGKNNSKVKHKQATKRSRKVLKRRCK